MDNKGDYMSTATTTTKEHLIEAVFRNLLHITSESDIRDEKDFKKYIHQVRQVAELMDSMLNTIEGAKLDCTPRQVMQCLQKICWKAEYKGMYSEGDPHEYLNPMITKLLEPKKE